MKLDEVLKQFKLYILVLFQSEIYAIKGKIVSLAASKSFNAGMCSDISVTASLA